MDEEVIALKEADGTFIDVGASVKVPPRFVIEDVLPTGIVFIGGPPKSLKSTFLYLLAVLVTGRTHKSLPEEMMKVSMQGRVLGLSAEASAGEIRYALENGAGVAMAADGSFLVAETPWDWRLDDPDALERLIGWLDALKPRVFFVDPLRDFHTLEEKDDGNMNRLLRPIQKWAKTNDAAFCVVHHASKKPKGDNTNYNPNDMRGTSALFGIADGVLMLTPKTKNVIHVHATIKRGEPWERSIQLGIWGKAADTTLSKNAVRLLKHLKQTDEAVPMGQLAKLLAMSKSTLVLAARELEQQGLIYKEGRQYKLC
jgi:hypothetical protein